MAAGGLSGVCQVTSCLYTHVMERYQNQAPQPKEALVFSARSVRKVSDAVAITGNGCLGPGRKPCKPETVGGTGLEPVTSCL
jgi:hypothetical protein